MRRTRQRLSQRLSPPPQMHHRLLPPSPPLSLSLSLPLALPPSPSSLPSLLSGHPRRFLPQLRHPLLSLLLRLIPHLLSSFPPWMPA